MPAEVFCNDQQIIPTKIEKDFAEFTLPPIEEEGVGGMLTAYANGRFSGTAGFPPKQFEGMVSKEKSSTEIHVLVDLGNHLPARSLRLGPQFAVDFVIRVKWSDSFGGFLYVLESPQHV